MKQNPTRFTVPDAEADGQMLSLLEKLWSGQLRRHARAVKSKMNGCRFLDRFWSRKDMEL